VEHLVDDEVSELLEEMQDPVEREYARALHAGFKVCLHPAM
jgi:hypothetical protein